MTERVLPRYPVYIPSKGRSATPLTARCLHDDGVPFYLVVEPQERNDYSALFGPERVLVLPWDNPGSVIPARNWIKEHATAAGHERHWQLDDNIRRFFRRWSSRSIPCDAGLALRACEDFTDRYENIAVSGLNYEMFAISRTSLKPLHINVHVYSCSLINNAISHCWRGRYNEDTDLCLQVLSDGWCTVLLSAFLCQKIKTLTMKGGNTDTLYQGHGRLAMAKELERRWPGIVTTRIRFGRPQHVIKDSWKRFDTPLRLKPGIDLDALPPNDYGMQLVQVKPTQSPTLRALVEAELATREPDAAGEG